MSLYDGNDFALVTSTDFEHSTNHDIIEYALIEINVWMLMQVIFTYPAQLLQTLSMWEQFVY